MNKILATTKQFFGIISSIHYIRMYYKRTYILFNFSSFHSQVFVLCAYGGDIREIMLNAKDLGLLNGKYAFIAVELNIDSHIGSKTWMGNDTRDKEALEAYNGILNVHLRTPDSPTWKNFTAEIRRRVAAPPYNKPLPADTKVT